MKKILQTLLVVIISITAQAQTPQGIPYQAAARNANGNIMANQAINVRFTIHDSSANGTAVYQETHSSTTNAQGMFSLNMGLGTPTTGNFNQINWGNNAKFMQVELSTNGGSNYTDMGTQQMMSVPYAMYAKSAVNGLPNGNIGDLLYHNGAQWQKLNSGSEGQVLTMASGIPSWKNPILSVGSFYGGGIVAYLLKPGDIGFDPDMQHGLIASINNIGTAQWGCYGTLIGDTATVLGTGQMNTNAILNSCNQQNTAARLCDNYIYSLYSDWYLPSSEEMIKLLNARNLIGGFSPNQIYWTSTEAQYTGNNSSGNFNAISVYVNVSYISSPNESFTQTLTTKNTIGVVRAVRSF